MYHQPPKNIQLPDSNNNLLRSIQIPCAIRTLLPAALFIYMEYVMSIKWQLVSIVLSNVRNASFYEAIGFF